MTHHTPNTSSAVSSGCSLFLLIHLSWKSFSQPGPAVMWCVEVAPSYGTTQRDRSNWKVGPSRAFNVLTAKVTLVAVIMFTTLRCSSSVLDVVWGTRFKQLWIFFAECLTYCWVGHHFDFGGSNGISASAAETLDGFPEHFDCLRAIEIYFMFGFQSGLYFGLDSLGGADFHASA